MHVREQQEKGKALINSLQSGNINKVFQNVARKETSQKKAMSSDLEKYFNLIQKRFEQETN